MTPVFWMNITAFIWRARVTQFGDVVEREREVGGGEGERESNG
jgi:hypothetical protein